MKRPKTLTAGILGTVGHALMSIILIVAFAYMLDLYEYLGSEPALLMGIFVAVAICGVVMSILTIVAWNKESAPFRKKYGIIITSIVFDFVVGIYSLICVFSAYETAIVIYLVLTALIITAAILKIIDLATEKNKATVANNEPVEIKPSINLKAASELEEKLTKLNNMKEHGLITEQEYSEIKTSYVKEYLK